MILLTKSHHVSNDFFTGKQRHNIQNNNKPTGRRWISVGGITILLVLQLNFLRRSTTGQGSRMLAFVASDMSDSIWGHINIATRATTAINHASSWTMHDLESERTTSTLTVATNAHSTSSDSSNNRTLVIVMGNVRGGEEAWKSLLRHVVDLNNADLALVVGSLPPGSEKRNSLLFQRANFVYEFDEPDDWSDVIRMMPNDPSWVSKFIPVTQKGGGWMGAVGNSTGSGALIFLVRWFVAQFIEQNMILHKYDQFVLTRSDHYYACNHDLEELDPKFMWVPFGEDYSGITDRHLVSSRNHILQAINIFPPMFLNPDKYANENFFNMGREKLLKARWIEEGLWSSVKRFDRVMFTCAVDGDTTRWSKKRQRVKEDVFLKYPLEYEEATCVCKTGHCEVTNPKKRRRQGYPKREIN